MKGAATCCLALALAASPLRADDSPAATVSAAPSEVPEGLSDRNLLQAVKLILFDTGEILTAPVRWDGTDWLKLGIGAGVVTGTVLALRRVPAAVTARAQQEGRRNDKKRDLTLRETDRPKVSSRKAQTPKLEKGPTGQRSSHRQPSP